MRHLRTSAALVLVVLTCLNTFVSAWYGTVTFYSSVEPNGPNYPWGISKTQRCYNLSCWDNRASSVKWEGLPTKGKFSGKARIAFFTGKDCTGASRYWSTDKKGTVDFKMSGIDEAVTSFIVWENSKTATNGFHTPCPWGLS